MRFENVSVVGVAHVDAPHRIASSVLEDRLAPALERFGVQPGLLENLSGIVARRWWDEGVQPSQVAALAAEKLIADTGIDRSRIGIVINTSVCRDFIEPSTASIVHSRLNLAPTCLNFDLGNACLGFMNAMEIIGNMIERGQIEFGLIVDGEGSRFAVDRTIERLLKPESDYKSFRAQFATLTLGSGSAAMLLGRADAGLPGHRLVGSVSLAATEYHSLCRGQVDHMETDTKQLLFAGLGLAQQTWEKAKVELGWRPEDLDVICMHQVSKVHTEQLGGMLELDLDRALRIYPEFGNVGPASVPIVLSKAIEEGRAGTGSRIALMGIGSGLNCAMAEIVW
jgi:3-oxoacyl-[acyl-carrier-protein] synthase III